MCLFSKHNCIKFCLNSLILNEFKICRLLYNLILKININLYCLFNQIIYVNY